VAESEEFGCHRNAEGNFSQKEKKRKEKKETSAKDL
jgi:hypothetical protein